MSGFGQNPFGAGGYGGQSGPPPAPGGGQFGVTRIVTRVQNEFDAVGQGSWCDKDYVLNFLDTHHEDVANILESLDLSYDTQVTVISALAAGTDNLSYYEAPGQSLAQIMYPVSLEWRLVGETDADWRPVPRVDKLEDTRTAVPGGAGATAGIASWEWRAGLIYITPSSVDVDLRVRLEELPAVLDIDSASYERGMTNVLVYGVCEHIAMTRGSGVSKLAPWFKEKYEKAFDTILDRLVKNEQTVPRRMVGRRSQQAGPLWRVPMG